MKRLTDRYYRMLDRISTMIRPPYFKSMEDLTIDNQDDQIYIMKKLLGDDIDWSNHSDGLTLYNDNGNIIYTEDSYGYWYKREYDDSGFYLIYFERYDGIWSKYEYDDNGNKIYSENSDGDWVKSEYDEWDNRIYYEDSDGYIEDNR